MCQVKESSEPHFLLWLVCVFVFVLGKIKCVHTQTQGDVWNKLCGSPLPHLEHELKDMRARSRSCWNKYSDMHRCGARTSVCMAWELLNSNFKTVSGLSLIHWPTLIWSTLSQTRRLRKVEMSLTLWCRYKRDKYKLWAFTDDSPPLSQLWSVSLPFRAVADGWQAWAMAIQLCNVEKETAICTFEDFKMLPCNQWSCYCFKPNICQINMAISTVNFIFTNFHNKIKHASDATELTVTQESKEQKTVPHLATYSASSKHSTEVTMHLGIILISHRKLQFKGTGTLQFHSLSFSSLITRRK